MKKISDVAIKQTVGWREWVTLVSFDNAPIKAKVDSGARTSALHVSDIEEFKKGKKTFVQFKIHPLQHNKSPAINCQSEVLEYRKVKSSTGHITIRPVIRAHLSIGPTTFETEITLVNRDMMGFRMLLGRQALRGRFLIDSGKSFLFKKVKVKKGKK